MTSEYRVAFVRAVILGSITGATTLLTTWATTNDPKTLFITSATAFLAPFAARFGGEGRLDTQRAQVAGTQVTGTQVAGTQMAGTQ